MNNYSVDAYFEAQYEDSFGVALDVYPTNNDNTMPREVVLDAVLNAVADALENLASQIPNVTTYQVVASRYYQATENIPLD